MIRTNATATLTVGATTSKTLTLSPKSDFSLTVTPSSKTITGGNPATFTVQLNPLSGFNSPVTLSVTGLPDQCHRQLQPGDNLLRHVNAHGHHQFDNARGQLHPHDFRRRHGPAALHASHPDGERRAGDRHRQSDQRRQRGADQRGQSLC